MKHLPTRLSLIALAAALPATAQAQSVNDFTLEPVPTPSATPQAQGPADTRSGVQIGPRAVNTPTPTPASSPTPQPSASPSQAPAAQATPRPSPLPTVTPRSVATVPSQSQASPTPTPPADSPIESIPDETVPAASPPPAVVATPAPETVEPEQPWPWALIGGIAALLALLAAGFFVWMRRRDAFVPEIERPVVAHAAPAVPASVAEALAISIEHEKLIRSAAFATLKYRMVLINKTDAPLADVTVGLDLVSAHAAVPMDQQVATSATALDRRHEIARIAPRQSVTLEGQVQLPLAQAHVIRQGRYPLLVPLLRVRVDGPGEGALVKTFVVGQGMPGGGRVQPFRLDEGPRSYAPIAQRELA